MHSTSGRRVPVGSRVPEIPRGQVLASNLGPWLPPGREGWGLRRLNASRPPSDCWGPTFSQPCQGVPALRIVMASIHSSQAERGVGGHLGESRLQGPEMAS